jgi:OmcA/MtrC family decaheme c-type cytochrome
VGYPASATFDFVPTGLTAATGREVVSDAACNACHGKLQAHDSRRTVKLCLTCHSPQTKDPETGNSLAMAEMIHKLHSGLDGYHIVGYSQHDVDYSKVAFAPPNSVANCAACHGGAAEADKAKVASVAACSTCHTSFDVTTHQEGTATPESCADCHPAAGVDKVHSELYAGKGLSFTETKLEITIDSVSYPTAGAAGTVAFTVKVNDAPRDVMASPLSSLRFTVAGPTEDYGSGIDSDSTVLGGTTPGYVQSAASPTFTAIDAAAGKFSIPLPALTGDVDGKSVGVGVEAYVYEFVSIGAPACASATAGPATATCVRKQHVGTPTAMVYAKVGGGTPTPRRTITSNAKCNACHNDLGFHSGDSRKTPEYCATCHNPVNVNDDRTTRLERTLDGSGVPTSTVYSFTPESVSIMMMAHKLHAGGALSNSYVLGNDMSMSATAPIATSATFAGAFPGDLADCQTCHEEGTYGLPDAGNLGTLEATFTCLEPQGNDTDNWCNTKANWPLANVPDNYTVTAQRFIPPQTAACTSCHDSEAAKAHAELNTSPSGVESCAVCHGEGATYDAIEVHVPRP